MKQKAVRKYGRYRNSGVTAPAMTLLLTQLQVTALWEANPVTAGAYGYGERYQWVTDGATGDSGFYLYSRKCSAKVLI
jgi:hypothetical protein